MKFTIEAKIGLIGIATLAVLIWGINYLKGRNILASNYTLQAYLQDAEGLENSTPILMHGIKVGYVREITFRPEVQPPILCELTVEKAFPVRYGSTAFIYSADILGTKAIRIELSQGTRFLETGDTLRIISEPNMLSSLQEQISPVMEKVGSLAVSMDTLATKLEAVVDSENIRVTIENLRNIATSLDHTLQPGGSLDQTFTNLASFSDMLSEQKEELDAMTSHFSSFSESLDNLQVEQLSENLVSVTEQFDQLLKQINSGEGSAGKLIYADSLYQNLDLLIADLDLLIRDLNENPQDYVHFSLFGKSQKEKE
jgi:phospholipid/cholesterol/gamma-HCH transport system substrate-binding protein